MSKWHVTDQTGKTEVTFGSFKDARDFAYALSETISRAVEVQRSPEPYRIKRMFLRVGTR